MKSPSNQATASHTPWPMPPFVRASVGLHLIAAASPLAGLEAMAWAAGGVGLNHAVLTAAGLWPRSRLLGPNLTRLPAAATARGAVAWTFDDGPDPDVTPALLDQLDAAQVRATFFCIAERAAQHPALLREIVARGHDLGNHSHSHRHHFSLLGPRGLAREIGSAQARLADLGGVLPMCFRAPAGLRNPFLDPVLHAQGLHLVSWTRRAFDTRPLSAAQLHARLAQGLAAGDILLAHDGHAARGASGRAVLLDALPGLLREMHERGLHGQTLREAVPPRRAAAAGTPAGPVAAVGSAAHSGR